MRVEILRRRIIFAAIAAFVLTILCYMGNAAARYSIELPWLVGPDGFLVRFELPALFLGLAVTGNVHQPSEVAYYFGLFVEWFVVAIACSFLFIHAPKLAGDEHA